MKKERRNILIFILILIVIILISYFIFISGITSKLKANAIGLTSNFKNEITLDDLPIINSVINSSGENLVNTDVVLIINASSKYNINKLEYSYDLVKWNKVKENFNAKEINARLIFSKTRNENVYIRVENDHGYKSYVYQTKVMIDKEKPIIIVGKNADETVIKAKDNNQIVSVQYSTDKLSWEDDFVSGESIVLTQKISNDTYIRVVDAAGNISDIKKAGD